MVILSFLKNCVDPWVEVYLQHIIQPFLRYHEVFYKNFNALLRFILDSSAPLIPSWFTANFITYARTLLVYPTLILLSHPSPSSRTAAAALVLLVDFGDFLDGVVARYWNDIRKKEGKNTR
jgi:CDP-alcohol phosphatidyltransferase